jgi:hypothetical protein
MLEKIRGATKLISHFTVQRRFIQKKLLMLKKVLNFFLTTAES